METLCELKVEFVTCVLLVTISTCAQIYIAFLKQLYMATVEGV